MIESTESTLSTSELIRTVGALVVRWQDSTQMLDEAVGELYGLSASERHCLSFLWPGPQSATAIARAIRLTPAAVTALIDRLEKRGYVVRQPDPDDRRKVLVAASTRTAELTREVYEPLGRRGAELLSQFSDDELRAFIRMLEASVEMQQQQLEELAARKP
ncbi:MAG TPA: MarR family transcriptional regulator [Devosia sp.]